MFDDKVMHRLVISNNNSQWAGSMVVYILSASSSCVCSQTNLHHFSTRSDANITFCQVLTKAYTTRGNAMQALRTIMCVSVTVNKVIHISSCIIVLRDLSVYFLSLFDIFLKS